MDLNYLVLFRAEKKLSQGIILAFIENFGFPIPTF